MPQLNIFGNDYNTPDRTGVRDYIHVMDLAEGHQAALYFPQKQTGWHAINLGTGQGYSVPEMVKAFEKACGKGVPHVVPVILPPATPIPLKLLYSLAGKRNEAFPICVPVLGVGKIKMIANLKLKSEFANNVLTLMLGTTIAQAIPIAISPILTRIYTPNDFGVFAVYTGIVGLLSAAATARYELAVMLPEKDADADALVILSVFIAAILGLATLLTAFMFNEPIAQILGNPQLAPWLYAIPLSLFLTGAYNALNYWLNRHKRYAIMSRNRVMQNGITGGANIGLGWAHWGAAGLIIGNLCGQALTTAMLGKQFFDNRVSSPESKKALQESKVLAIRYKNHPIHLLPAQWIGAAALQIPVFVISSAFGSAVTGFYSLAARMISMPSLLIANAIGDVYRQQASVAYRENGQFKSLFFKTVTKSFQIAIVPFLAIFFLAPGLFAFVLGEPWRGAGEYARILVVASFFQFLFTPIDKGALIVGATRYIFFWHLARFLMLGFAGICVCWLKFSIEIFLILIVAVNCVLYLVEGIQGYQYSNGIKNRKVNQ